MEHGLHAASVLRHPFGDLAEVPDCRREPDELDGGWGLDDYLLPDGAPREVVDVVDLVQDDIRNRLQPLQLFVDQVAQNLGRHHDDWSVRVDRVLTGDQPDCRLAVLANEVVVLLIAQRLQWCRVDDFGAGAQSAEYRVLGDDGLAARGRSADQDTTAAAVQLLDRLALEAVELEGQRRLEFFDQRV
jgi:hypothetical protein